MPPSMVFASCPPLTASFLAIGVLFALCPLALTILRLKAASTLIYLLGAAAATTLLVSGATHLLRQDAPQILILPLGLPWLGAHFRLDALSAAFLIIVNLGAVSASAFAVGYGRHERARARGRSGEGT